jgi:hypothetical protein
VDRPGDPRRLGEVGLAYKRRAEAPIEIVDPDRALAARQAALEDRRKALGRFRDFLVWVPLGALADEAQSYVLRLQGDIDSEEIAIADELARRQRAADEARALAAARRSAQRRRTRWHVGAAVIGGVGLGAIGLGTYYGVRARSLSRELSNADEWSPARTDQVAEGEQADRLMIGLTVGGSLAVLAAGAAVWYVYRDPLPAESPITSIERADPAHALAARLVEDQHE